MDRYVEGSARARVWYLFACAALVLAAALLPQFEVLFPLPQDTSARLQALTRLELVMALVSVTLLLFSRGWRCSSFSSRDSQSGMGPGHRLSSPSLSECAWFRLPI